MDGSLAGVAFRHGVADEACAPGSAPREAVKSPAKAALRGAAIWHGHCSDPQEQNSLRESAMTHMSVVAILAAVIAPTAPGAPPTSPAGPPAERPDQVVLEDGTRLWAARDVIVEGLQEGVTVKLSYEERGGEHVVTSIESA